MKTKLILIITVLSLLAILQFAEATSANPVGIYGQKPKHATVTVDSPAFSPQLAFTIRTNHYWATGANLSDSHCFIVLGSNTIEVDNLTVASNTTISNDYAYQPYTQYTLKGTINLSQAAINLSNGTFDVKINYGYYNYGFVNREYAVEFVTLGYATSKVTLTQDLPETPLASPEASTASPTPTNEPSSPQGTPVSVESQVSSNDPIKQTLVVVLIFTIGLALSLILLVTLAPKTLKSNSYQQQLQQRSPS